MSSSKGLKRADNISTVNPLVLETLEKLIEKSKPISTLKFDNDIDNLYFSIKSKSLKINEINSLRYNYFWTDKYDLIRENIPYYISFQVFDFLFAFIPLVFLNSSTARSKSPSDSSRALLQSTKPRPVFSLNSFT